MSFISVRGAQEHNLKNIDVDIPKNSLIAFTGVSGSGKSSLVFDTIYAEAFRRFVDSTQAPVYMLGGANWRKSARAKFSSIKGLPPALGLSQRQGVAGKLSTVGTIIGVTDLFRVYFAAFGDVFCHNCDIPLKSISFPELINKIFTDFLNKKIYFIAPICEKRKGSFTKEIENFKDLGYSKLRINGEMYDLQEEQKKFKIDAKKLNTIDVVIDFVNISIEKKLRIERSIYQALEHGKGILKIEYLEEQYKFNTKSSCPQCGESAPKLDPRYFSHSSLGKCKNCEGEGSEKIGLPSDIFPCKVCQGSRLDSNIPIVRICNTTFMELHRKSFPELFLFVSTQLKENAGNDKAKLKVYLEIQRLLKSMHLLTLDHLVLNRSGNSLSPGDLQRLRLASMISNRLKGVLYAIDEPCQGLTAEEVKRLVFVLQELVKDGASIISVEHHPVFLSFCEKIFLMGPGAGVHGGQVVSKATAPEGLADTSLSHNYEKNLSKFLLQEQGTELLLRKSKGRILNQNVDNSSINSSIENSSIHFSEIAVRNLSLNKILIKQGIINIIRGKSGSGKTSFTQLCLIPYLLSLGKINLEGDDFSDIPYKLFCKVKDEGDILVNIVSYVKPGSITRSSKRSVASALDVIKPIRDLFTKIPASQIMGLTESHFSWNSKLGKCEYCEGKGYKELPQRYSEPVRIECENCLGAKLNPRSLLPRFKGLNLADIMNLSLDQALNIFENHKLISSRIFKACQFGLGYVRLGQGMETLSGGEVQRLNLTLHLKRSNLHGAWFILTHPSTGLHAPDIEILGNLMKVMTSKGASFVLIENREEFLPFSQHIVEF
ncbi:hypothetical protein QEJ31_07605 [Pigmentibacter sp. JX0631]|uniref:hypothetical protein n=1 Tax=Pigmentibacter sp. JX0631 TaxID=2976982 RepID=UPI0024684660|nr:hypothetical protein [Pigmentibacter sp. JX0631]WGL61453.1 hypothetical protein QEJ31_07605 [Pigmentibacter sp. JX0631]